MLGWLGTRSIATRLFLSAAFWSVLILLLAGVTLATFNRRSAESDFDERLSVYLRALAANFADPGEDARSNLGQLGEVMFELPLSGWYWQITPLDGDANDIRASRSLFAERLPKLQDSGVQAGVGGTRKGYAIGPDDRRLRIVERVIDTGDKHHSLVQVAASPDEVEADIPSFNVALPPPPPTVRHQAQIMRPLVTNHLPPPRAAARSTVIGNVTEVKPVIEGLVRTFGKIYRDRDIVFEASLPDGLRFRGEKQDLEDLVGNLVDNAGKWAQGRVTVTVQSTNDPGELGPSALLILVDDDGAGLDAEARGLVARRGRRRAESKPGSGLGLSIVTDLAGTYGGSFSLDESPLGGLRAVLRLPGSRTDFRPNPV